MMKTFTISILRQKLKHDTSIESEAGFSLLEMLIALAIMSLTSLALFQSMGKMLYVSNRAVDVSEQALERAIANRTLAQLIDSLVPDWSLRPEDSFSGQRLSFSGISAKAVHSIENENAAFTVSLRLEAAQNESVIVYEADNISWVVSSGLKEAAYFEYLDKKNTWHAQWPPVRGREISKAESFDDLDLIKMPQAIRISQKADVKSAFYVVGRHQSLLNREEYGRE